MVPEKHLRPSDLVKSAGLEDLYELSYITEQSEQTLINWFKNPKKRMLFECAVLGAALMKKDLISTPSKYWLYGYRKINRKYDARNESYTKELYRFAQHCVNKFPASLGHPECTDRGTPQDIIKQIDHPD